MSITARIDAITRIGDAAKAVAPIPRSVKIELTSRCNYRCSFCVKSLRSDNQDMDRALYSRLIREFRAAGVEELGVFYIGESFVCRWLPEAIAEAKEVGFPYVFLTTNGSMATPDRVQACMDAGLDSLKFSLNFCDSHQLETVAGVNPGFWARALENLKAAREIRDSGDYHCGLYASSIALTGAQGDAMKNVVRMIEPFVDQHYWLPLYGMDGASLGAGLKPSPGNPGRMGAMVDPLPCWAVFTGGHVTHDGLLAACCFGAGVEGSLVMADLKETSFVEGWNSLEFQKLRSSHLSKSVTGTPCEVCVAGVA